jgi:ribosome-binding factor A
MNTTRRQKKVSSLIKEEISRLLIGEIQDAFSGLITVTKVEMAADLKTAYIYLSIFGVEHEETVLEFLDKKKGYLRKAIASKVKLKYNPMLIFSKDPGPGYQSKIDRLLEDIKKNEK